MYACEDPICGHSEERSSDDSFCLQLKVQHAQARIKKISTPSHLITNLAYRLKQHHTRNQYLRARLDTCVDVNIMPASVYRLVFKDPDLKKLDPNNMEIGTYTTDTVKIVGSCQLYLLHPDTKTLHEVIFFVARNDGSVLLSWKLHLCLDFNNQEQDLIIHHQESSLITSSVNHSKKTKCPVTVHSSRKVCTVSP